MPYFSDSLVIWKYLHLLMQDMSTLHTQEKHKLLGLGQKEGYLCVLDFLDLGPDKLFQPTQVGSAL